MIERKNQKIEYKEKSEIERKGKFRKYGNKKIQKIPDPLFQSAQSDLSYYSVEMRAGESFLLRFLVRL